MGSVRRNAKKTTCKSPAKPSSVESNDIYSSPLLSHVDATSSWDTVLQLAMATHLTVRGGRACQRAAVILADGAVEELLNDVLAPIKRDSQWLDELIGSLSRRIPATVQEGFRRNIPSYMNDERRLALDRDFARKAHAVVGMRHIAGQVADALVRLHCYRNELQHGQRIRLATLRSAAELLVRIGCILLRAMKDTMSCSEADSQDARWLECNLGRDVARTACSGNTALLCDQLEAALGPGPSRIQRSLHEHLSSRLDSLNSNLARLYPSLSQQDTLWLIQFTPSRPIRARDPRRWFVEFRKAVAREGRTFRPQYTSATIEDWRKQTHRLAAMTDPVQAFALFARIEAKLEPLELQVASITEDRERYEGWLEDWAVEEAAVCRQGVTVVDNRVRRLRRTSDEQPTVRRIGGAGTRKAEKA